MRKFLLYWFVLGSLLFLMYADFYFLHNNEPLDPARNIWDDIYYVWDMAKDLIVLIVIRKLVTIEEKKFIQPLFYYCSIRLLWALITPLTNLDRNYPLTATIMFTILIIGVIVLLIRDLKMLAQKDL